jgi:hypothetical protein
MAIRLLDWHLVLEDRLAANVASEYRGVIHFVGAGLLANAVDQVPAMVADKTGSPASRLLQTQVSRQTVL